MTGVTMCTFASHAHPADSWVVTTATEAPGKRTKDVEAVTIRNPFAVNDLWFARETGIEPEDMNAYGCSLISGHRLCAHRPALITDR